VRTGKDDPLRCDTSKDVFRTTADTREPGIIASDSVAAHGQVNGGDDFHVKTHRPLAAKLPDPPGI